MKKALITGVTGQDGSYLSSHLLNEGYYVYGSIRRSSNPNLDRLNYFNLLSHKNFRLVELDLLDLSSINSFFHEFKVDEVYNLAAQSFVAISFDQPILTAKTTGLGVLNILEAIKNSNKSIKFYQASSSELYGKVQETPQSETTPFYPRSPYAVSKLFAHWTSINYRESYGIFTSNGILFNHESPLRGYEFVTRKITSSIAKIKVKKLSKLVLGNLDAKRDWGFAGDYVTAMHAMLQQSTPEDYVVATGITHSVRDFLKMAFIAADIDISFEGKGIEEVGVEKKSGNILVSVSKEFYRPAEVDLLIGDSTKANKNLNWKASTSLDTLVQSMVDYDIKLENN